MSASKPAAWTAGVRTCGKSDGVDPFLVKCVKVLVRDPAERYEKIICDVKLCIFCTGTRIQLTYPNVPEAGPAETNPYENQPPVISIKNPNPYRLTVSQLAARFNSPTLSFPVHSYNPGLSHFSVTSHPPKLTELWARNR